MAKSKVKEEVAIEEVAVQVNEAPVWQGHPSRDLRVEGMVWNPFIGKYVWPSTEEPATEEASTEEPIAE